MNQDDSEPWKVVVRKKSRHVRQSEDEEGRQSETPPKWRREWIGWAFDSQTPTRYYAFPSIGEVPQVGEPLPEIEKVFFHVQDDLFSRTLVQLRESHRYAYLLFGEDRHFGDRMGLYEIYLASELDDLFQAYPLCKELYDEARSSGWKSEGDGGGGE